MSLKAALTGVGLLAVCMVSSNSPLFAQQKAVVVDKIACTVGDRIVLYSEIENSIADAHRQGQQIPGNAFCLVMEQAVVSKLLMLQAEKDSLSISEEEVEAVLNQKVRYFINLLGSKEKLEQYAGKNIYQIKDDARDAVREQKLAAAMQEQILGRVSVSPSEVSAFFNKIPKDSLPFIESEVEIGQIVLNPRSSGELDAYIVSELNNYKRQVERGVASFEQLASQFSEHIQSKQRAGFVQVNRNDQSWGQAFLSAAFKLKEGEMSEPVKSEKHGFFLIKMENRQGDEADLRIILREPVVTESELAIAKGRLDSIRSSIVAGRFSFNEAARKYTEDDQGRFWGPFFLNQDGSAEMNIDQLDAATVAVLRTLSPGEISAPVSFTNEQGKKAARILYLKSRTEPHIMNMRDDYRKIANAALEEKKQRALQNWLSEKMANYFIAIDSESRSECPLIAPYANN